MAASTINSRILTNSVQATMLLHIFKVIFVVAEAKDVVVAADGASTHILLGHSLVWIAASVLAAQSKISQLLAQF